METSLTIGKLTEALAKAQIAFLPIKQTERVDFTTKTGGRKKYNYAPLSEVIDAIRKALSDNALAIMQPTKLVEGKLIVETLLSHSSGEWVKGEILIESQTQDAQSQGSALTYARRYALSSLLGIASEEDDDAESATHKESVKPKPTEDVIPITDQSVKEAPLEAASMSVEDLFQWVAKNMKWKTTTSAKSWIVNKCRIDEARIANDTQAVKEEIRQLQNW